ncbi:MAG: hypothetical protein J0H26_01460, partial [Alphaproteobacteria bacterium]|nr:hypothetical protein [Alphaproteobacteria bacterium]
PVTALSIPQANEAGCVYTPGEVAAMGAFAREKGLRFHMDGARFANAVAHLECSPAAASSEGGVEALSFGFVKNGGMGAEALIFFAPDMIEVTRYNRKRAGHLQSKGRYLAAQLLAMLKGDLWLDNARRANAAKEYLVSLGVSAARIDTISYGKERPTCTESTESCWAQNRRDVTTITSGAAS